MTFRPRPYDPDRASPGTPAQRAARMRNFEIFKLRGLWCQAGMLDEPIRTAVRALIDLNLVTRGARPQREHERISNAKRARKSARQRDRERYDPADFDVTFQEDF